MNILSLSTTYPESNNPTKGSFVHLLNKAIVKQNHKIVAVTPHIQNTPVNEIMDNVKIKRFRYLPKKYENFEGGIAESTNKSKIQILKAAFMILFFITSSIKECIKEKPDIIHAHWAFPSAFVGYLLAIIFRKKLFVTVYAAEFAVLKKRFRILKPLIKIIFNKSTKIIGITSFATKKAIEFGADESKVVVIRPIPNYVTHDYSEKEKIDYKNNLEIINQKIILFVGRLIEHKGVSYLIESMSGFSKEEVKLIIAGGGPQYNILKNRVKQLEKNNQITFVKNPTDANLGLLYQIADIFVLPSIDDSKGDTEGLGLVMIEAMKCKIPVIATNAGGASEVIGDEYNGLIAKQKDPESLIKCIKRLFHNEQLVKQLVNNSQETVEEYSSEKIAKQHIDLFLN
jgi:glycosyltransferase involved in cell wall biosynthesis